MKKFTEFANGSKKVYGYDTVVVLPNGTRLNGRYVIFEFSACAASHNPMNGFAKTTGFPTDENGNSVNDRDYERDKDAQVITRQIAAKYDERAFDVVISKDGIVLSGNGRYMAGIIAATNNTDQAYIDGLKKQCKQFGFDRKQVKLFSHARVAIELDAPLPYTAETFAMFNAKEMKGQSKTEEAVKMGKLVSDKTYNRIISEIALFDSVSDFYKNIKSAKAVLADLKACGVVSAMEWPEMFDGDSISIKAQGIIENVLIGHAFCEDGDTVRKITYYKSVRKIVISALCEIGINKRLNDYSLATELTEAINLVYDALNAGYQRGEIVSGYSRQVDMFSGATVSDYTNRAVAMLADILNGKQANLLRRIFGIYNSKAKDNAEGQLGMFGGIETKESILSDVCSFFETASVKDQRSAMRAIDKERVIDAREAKKQADMQKKIEATKVKSLYNPAETFDSYLPKRKLSHKKVVVIASVVTVIAVVGYVSLGPGMIGIAAIAGLCCK